MYEFEVLRQRILNIFSNNDIAFAHLISAMASKATCCYKEVQMLFFEGAENCLEGLSFVITGVLESIEREQAVDLVKRHGGKVVSAVSKRTNYLVVGRDPGDSKLQKVF